ncbi:hypothetical protein [Streptomyces sp. NRRL S-1521]|uniref:hypothetical protein n=1 Tax=Streptomyces sp. NRRL S-1521 TaxID=1609100 RepID=UPI000AC4C7A5|nr:hypothetical protein [Streptomyces sp. NRRL S-1521]
MDGHTRKKQKAAVRVCKRHLNTAVSPATVAAALNVRTRYLPASALPMTGAQALAALQEPPSWVTEGQQANAERLGPVVKCHAHIRSDARVTAAL